MDRLAGMAAFAAVVEAGSFARAAERRGVSTSTLSRLVADLESHLGARLLNRTTRRLSLTEGGQAFYERVLQVLADVEEAEAVAAMSAGELRGTIRLTCSFAFGVQRLAPAIAGFVAQHPDVRFDVSVSDRVVDLVEEGFDLAVRIGRAGSDTLVARRLGEMRLLLAASPAYLRGRGSPRDVHELRQHVLLTYAYAGEPGQWRLVDAGGVEHVVPVRPGPVHANSGDLLAAVAAAGLGIVCEPDFILGPWLSSGRLVGVLPGLQSPAADIWAVYPTRRHLSLKVRRFVDHLIGALSPRVAPPEPQPAATVAAAQGRPRAGHRDRKRAGRRRIAPHQ
jgi:DNA-binding transcriptional LysR family regulator